VEEGRGRVLWDFRLFNLKNVNDAQGPGFDLQLCKKRKKENVTKLQTINISL
jgi:hypothetical protein